MPSKKKKDHKNTKAAEPVPPKGKRRLLFKLVALFGIPLLFLVCLVWVGGICSFWVGMSPCVRLFVSLTICLGRGITVLFLSY